LFKKSSFFFWVSSSNFSFSYLTISCHSSPDKSEAIEFSSISLLLPNASRLNLPSYPIFKSAKLLDVSETLFLRVTGNCE